MAATGPDPVSVRITAPFHEWVLPGPLVATGTFAPSSAEVDVEVRYVNTVTRRRAVLYPTSISYSGATWTADFDPSTVNFPTADYVCVVAIASDPAAPFNDTCEDAISVFVTSSRLAGKGAQYARSKRAKPAKRTKGKPKRK